MNYPLLDRCPPRSLEAEQAVLGALLMERDAIERVVGMLSPADFYSPQHGDIYRAVVKLFANGKPVDLITVEAELRDTGKLTACGGRSYLIALQEPAPTAAAVESYALIVKGKYLLRKIVDTAEESRRLAMAGGESAEPDEILERVQGLWQKLEAATPEEDLYSLRQVIGEACDQIEEQANSPGMRGMLTGSERWDNITGGIHPSRLYVVGAGAKHGKTTVLTNWLSHLAFREAVPCAMFSLEMSRHEIAQKIISAEGGVDSFHLRMARLEDDEWHRIWNAAAERYDAPLYLDDNSANSLASLSVKLRKAARRYGVRVAGVDYFQLISTSRAESKRVGYVEVCHGLKQLTRETGVAIILLSQLGRLTRGEQRRPILSDFQETSALEQDANVATLLYHRPKGVPNPDGDVLELIVAGNRHGPSGTAPVWWEPRYQRISCR